MSSIGEKIYKLRSERGLTLEELAQKIVEYLYHIQHYPTSSNIPTNMKKPCICLDFDVLRLVQGLII